MVNWQSQDEVAKDGLVFSRLMHCLLGVYLWEFFVSLPFDFDFILRRKAFKWPLIFYFAGRYSLLFALIGIAIALNVTEEVNCQALYIFDQVFGNAAIGFASINLSLRTIAVWSQSVYIVVPLVFIILGHWSLLLHGLLISAAWEEGACVITKTDNKVLAATFIYSMGFDLLVLCLTGYKLLFPRSGRSKLVKMIFGDGLIFFIVAFVANLIATIFMVLNLNAVMSIIFNVPAAIASTIVASRAVRRLTNFTSKGPEVFSSRSAGQASSTLAFRGTGPYRSGTISNKGDGVHIQMDTITTLAESGDRSFIEYDASGKIKGENYMIDPESQEISDEFKRPPY